MLCHNAPTATLLINFGFGYVLQYTSFVLNFSAFHFTHSYSAKEDVSKCKFRHILFVVQIYNILHRNANALTLVDMAFVCISPSFFSVRI